MIDVAARLAERCFESIAPAADVVSNIEDARTNRGAVSPSGKTHHQSRSRHSLQSTCIRRLKGSLDDNTVSLRRPSMQDVNHGLRRDSVRTAQTFIARPSCMGGSDDVRQAYKLQDSLPSARIGLILEDIEACPMIRPAFNASMSAASSISPPRAVLIRMAPDLIPDSASRPMRCRVPSVRGR